MYFQFLVEDKSGGILIDLLMKKIQEQAPETTYDIKSFRGLGGFTRKNTVKETKDGQLLNDLSTYLRGFNRSLAGFPAAVVVVLDNDDNDPAALRQMLEQVSEQNRIEIDHVFCLAIEELEAWLLGDEAAILAAYPDANRRALHEYEQDSICGTWEVLADVVYDGGCAALKKQPWNEIGRMKSVWAQEIGRHLSVQSNRSPSFQAFLQEILNRVA